MNPFDDTYIIRHVWGTELKLLDIVDKHIKDDLLVKIDRFLWQKIRGTFYSIELNITSSLRGRSI
jgi:hypothetical protein